MMDLPSDLQIYWFADGDEDKIFVSEVGKGYVNLTAGDDQPTVPGPGVGCLVINANAERSQRTKRKGLRWLQNIRREYGVTAHAIVYSFESFDTLSSEYSILKTKGVSYIRLPFLPADLNEYLENPRLARLTEEELHDVVRWHCGLQEEWRAFSHGLGNLLADYTGNHGEIRRMVGEWASSVRRFAPDQRENLDALENLTSLASGSLETVVIRMALERLDDGLQGSEWLSAGDPTDEDYVQFPSRPPKGFSKVLIADDEPQSYLINSLRNQYGYDVVGQAERLSRAKELLNKEKPDVVLSDYYFKETSRRTELPDKAIGDRFIHYALTHPQYAGTDPKKPIVLVISKATLRTDTEIRKGAINCSGANRATDPMFLHGVIWDEARKRGVSEPEDVFGQEWTLEHTCRQRLEQYRNDLPKLKKQWDEFKSILRDTLRLCRLLSQSVANDDPEIVLHAISALEPYENQDNLSLATVSKIFSETERVHRKALSPPHSQAKQAIRNILHGKIEQFSSVSNAVKFLLKTLPSVARDLASMPQHRRSGLQLNKVLAEYSESQPLLPVLELLDEILIEALSNLPGLPSPPKPSRVTGDMVKSNKINILIVEDNEYWSDYVIRAVKKIQSILGRSFNINYEHFDNSADALAAVHPTAKSFAIDGSNEEEVKTIVIADICLPKDRGHAETIRAALEGRSQELALPHSTHGLNMIHKLCSYHFNVPLIVFSTIDSIRDRKMIGAWGVPDEDFLAKDVDGEKELVRALIRKIEKRTKYVIKRYEEAGGNIRFWINGIEITFTNELRETFSAFYGLCQDEGKNECHIAEIIEARGWANSEESKKAIQDQIYRIRNTILETLQANRTYVNVRELIKTIKTPNDEYAYQLNAEVTPADEEDDYEVDIQQYENEICRVLVIENNPQTLGTIIKPLESLGYEVRYATNVDDAVLVAKEFSPHVISLDLQIPRTRAEAGAQDSAGDEYAGLEAWTQIRTALSSNALGVVVPTVNADKNYLVAKAAQMEIPIRNFISKHEEGWLNLFLKKVADERRRVFLGEISDASSDVNEPIVELLDGTDLPSGVLRLSVNDKPFTMKKGTVSKIIGHLLASPKTLHSFEDINAAVGGAQPLTANDMKNWTKRIRKVIRDKWLNKSIPGSKELAEIILESSKSGLRLNVQVIDTRLTARREQKA